MAESRETGESGRDSSIWSDGVEKVEGSDEEVDLHAQLAHKERNLVLAAELGKALLDSNQELQSRYDRSVDDFSRKIETLQQEKYDLHLELEKMATEYRNAMKDLQDDMSSLRKQVRNNDQMQNTERERSRSLREAQQTVDFLTEQVRQATARAEELQVEMEQHKAQCEAHTATIQDQVDHITMLREQVEYLSEKLRETNQKLLEVQGERDILYSKLETADETIQSLETQAAVQNERIHRQIGEIEELQESNSNLQLQCQSLKHYSHHQAQQLTLNLSHGGTNKNNSSEFIELKQAPSVDKRQEPNALFQRHQHERPASPAGDSLRDLVEIDTSLCENSLASLSKSTESTSVTDGGHNNGNNCSSLLNTTPGDPPFQHHHRRNISDCSISSISEGSRKRQHHNIFGNSDEEGQEEDGDNRNTGAKQTFYSRPRSKNILIQSPAAESNLSRIYPDKHGGSPHNAPAEADYRVRPGDSVTESPSRDAHEDVTARSLPTNAGDNNHTFKLPIQRDSLHFSQHNFHTSKDRGGQSLLSELGAQDDYYDSDDVSEVPPTSLFSELSHHVPDMNNFGQEKAELSLFSELSSQLVDDRNGNSSDSSSNCMLGVFDFFSLGSDCQEENAAGNQDLNAGSLPNSSSLDTYRQASDMLGLSSEVQEEEDDFECDDDDFLVGNTAGSTLSIGNAGHDLLFHYHHYEMEDGMSDRPRQLEQCAHSPSASREWHGCHAGETRDEQRKIAQACEQLRDLVLQVQNQTDLVAEIPHVADSEGNPDQLLLLIGQMKLCIDKLTAGKDGVLSDIPSSVMTEVQRGDKADGLIIHPEVHKLQPDITQFVPQTRIEAESEQNLLMKKSKSSSSLLLRKSL